MGVGDRPIGRTIAFDAMNKCSNHFPRAYVAQLFPAPCRHCSGPAYMQDGEGAIHPCCELMWDGRRCLSCESSEMLNREQRRRHGGRNFAG